MRFLTRPKLKAPKQHIGAYKQWIDPFPDIPGTKPEKIVYAEMMQRGIPFQFQDFVNFNLPLLETNKWFRADFSVPEAMLILNVNGAYWHTQPNQIEKDATIDALAELSGWRVVTWWDFDIYNDVVKLFDTDPYLSRWPRKNPIPHRAHWYKDSKGIQTINIRRTGRIKRNEKTVTIRTKRPPRKPRAGRYKVKV